MEYIEVNFEMSVIDPWRDLLADELGEIGFESFVETDKGLTAFVQADLFKEELIKNVDSFSNEELSISYTWQKIEDQNWNEEWEKNFEPILIEDKCAVRATFHELEQSFQYDILIDPKMSFGTGHHATTYLILEKLLQMDTSNQSVLDMGCGTGVLAILAKMKGAGKTLAIDIDEWAYNNTVENIAKNNVASIEVKQGDIDLVEGEKFDLIIANINKNIILRHLSHYGEALESGGTLLTSGFYESDLNDVSEKAKESGLKYVSHKVRDSWTLGEFVKI